jgi:hypothetical protein
MSSLFRLPLHYRVIAHRSYVPGKPFKAAVMRPLMLSGISKVVVYGVSFEFTTKQTHKMMLGYTWSGRGSTPEPGGKSVPYEVMNCSRQKLDWFMGKVNQIILNALSG